MVGFAWGCVYQKPQPQHPVVTPGMLCGSSTRPRNLPVVAACEHSHTTLPAGHCMGGVTVSQAGREGHAVTRCFWFPFSLQENSHYTDVEDARLQ